jgi:pimeloyl-ACP methyl ester carboxylesterase
MPFLLAGGHRLEYEWVGPEKGRERALVFLHEGLGCVAMWRGFAAALAERVHLPGLLYSRWGHGRSDRLDRPRGPRFMHEEALVTLPEVLATFAIREPILVGHSDGASIALIYAGGSGGRARALILEAPHVLIEKASGLDDLVARYETTDLRARLARYHGDNADSMFRGWSGIWQDPAMDGWNIEDHVARVTCPTLVIQGEGDEYATVEQLERIARGASGSVESMMLAACGHVPHKDQREAVLEIMSRFILRVGSRTQQESSRHPTGCRRIVRSRSGATRRGSDR